MTTPTIIELVRNGNKIEPEKITGPGFEITIEKEEDDE
jgi:hypothetical protein